MGFYLRKSVSVGPFRFNLSQRGVGVSVGVKGLRVGSGPRGNYVQMGRGGLYYRAALSPPVGASRPARYDQPDLPALPQGTVSPMREIESSDASAMVDSSSRDLLEELNRKHSKFRLCPAAATISTLIVWLAWSGAWPEWQLVLSAVVGTCVVLAAYAYDVVSKTVVVLYELDSDMERAYEQLHAAAAQMAACSALWHVEAQGDVHNSKYHAGAKSVVRRKRTAVVKDSHPYLKTNIQTVAIGVGRQTLHFFPDRVLVYQGGRVGAVPYDRAHIVAGSTRFVEEASTPHDATVVDRTWRFVNKGGGPDKRFKNNRELPVCLYGELTFSSPTGLNELMQLSRHDVGPLFAEATRALARVIPVEKPSSALPRPIEPPPAPSRDLPPRSLPPPREPTIPLFELPAVLPPLSLLDDPKPQLRAWSDGLLQADSAEIESQLEAHNIKAKVVGVYPGPVLTRYELVLGPGVRATQVSHLDRDIARWLSVKSVEVVKVIEGKQAIGIDISNTFRQTIYVSELLRSKAFDKAAGPLTLALGVTADGQPAIADLAQMPHLLVAGTTGSGKSVALNAMLLSLLYKATPSELRFLLIDTTNTELGVYEGLPHLLAPVIRDADTAAKGLRWCVAEMERRYRLMAAIGARLLPAFNDKVREATASGHALRDPFPRANHSTAILGPLPHIVVMIDAFADLGDEEGSVEELVQRLAQKAASAGIHLVLATQRPTSGAVTGLTKASIPSRLAFQVASRADSNAILDRAGAEELLGNGDMLYLQRGSNTPMRVHGAMVSDDEVQRVVHHLRMHSAATPEVSALGFGSPDPSEEDDDPLFGEALRVVTETGHASISGVQRRLKIGYNRAARLVERLERDGWISPPNPQGDRTVLHQPQ